MTRVHCLTCVHYFVTWESGQPHGCKAYGFKSKLQPSMVVRQSSGQTCQVYEDKRRFKK